jgi:hypothetical protein
VTGLLPHIVQHAIVSRSVSAASQSFGLVALILLLVLLVEADVSRVARRPSPGVARQRLAQRTMAWAISTPLLVAVVLTIAARLALLYR